MGPRKLTQNQTRRINKRSEQKIENQASSDLVSSISGEGEPGRIMAHYGQTLEVQNQAGLIFKCFARQNLGLLVAGDRVLFLQESPEEGVITARLPRTSFLQRPDIHKGQKGIAANIDQIFIVIAVNPPPIEHVLDRALVAACHQNIPALIILNKTDLLSDIVSPLEGETDQQAAGRLVREGEENNFFKTLTQRYLSIGYEVLELGQNNNQNNNSGLEKLLEKIKDKTSIFVGQSGVGKSSLLNKIFGNLAKVGEVSEANQRGKHTTTTARLYQDKLNLSPETCLIDSPGIREFGLWDLSPEELIQGFTEFKPYISQCQFRNCAHQENSKGCAIQKAVQMGVISHERLSSYFRILAGLKI